MRCRVSVVVVGVRRIMLDYANGLGVMVEAFLLDPSDFDVDDRE